MVFGTESRRDFFAKIAYIFGFTIEKSVSEKSCDKKDVENRTRFDDTGLHRTVHDVASSISDLRNLRPAPNQVALVKSYYEDDNADVGGGIFWWDAGADAAQANGGTAISSAVSGYTSGDDKEGRWQRVYDEPVNVAWFGARGNGVANDRGPIQDAIDAHGKIYIPAGTHVIEGSLVADEANIHVTGDGRESVIKLTDNSVNLFDVTKSGFSTEEVRYIAPNESYDGSNGNQANCIFVRGGGPESRLDGFTSRNCWFEGGVHHIRIDFVDGAETIGNVFETTHAGRAHVVNRSSHNSRHLNNKHRDAGGTFNAWWDYGGEGEWSKGCLVSGNDIHGEFDFEGINVFGREHVISENRIHITTGAATGGSGNATCGIALTQDKAATSIQNYGNIVSSNSIYLSFDAPKWCIRVEDGGRGLGVEDNLIQGNLLRTNGAGGILVGQSEGVQIHDNVMRLAAAGSSIQGIFAKGNATHLRIKGNSVRNSGAEAYRIQGPDTTLQGNVSVGAGTEAYQITSGANGLRMGNNRSRSTTGAVSIYFSGSPGPSDVELKPGNHDKPLNVSAATFVDLRGPVAGGSETQDGDGSTTTFTIQHDLDVVPTTVTVDPGSADAAGDFHMSMDATEITVEYATAPASGTSNLTWFWHACT